MFYVASGRPTDHRFLALHLPELEAFHGTLLSCAEFIIDELQIDHSYNFKFSVFKVLFQFVVPKEVVFTIILKLFSHFAF